MGHYNEALIGAYAANGHVVSYLTSTAGAELSASVNVRISRLFRCALDRSRPRFVRAGAYAAAELMSLVSATRDRSQAVVVHFVHLPAVDYLSLLLHRLMGRRIVLVAHDPFPVGDRRASWPYVRVHRLADVVVVHGPTARRDVLRLGVRSDRIVLAPFGDFRSVERMDVSAASQKLGLPDRPEAPVAVIVGNLRPSKGIRRAVQALSASDSPVRSLLVAGTKQGRWDLDDALQTPAGSRLRVIRHDGRMTDDEELAAYSLGDVVLALHERGYSSGVIARAHAVGRPVVLTDVGDLADQRALLDAMLPADYGQEDLRAAIARVLDTTSGRPRRVNDRWIAHVTAVTARLTSGDS